MIKKLLKKHQNFIIYVFFSFCTGMLSIGLFGGLNALLGEQYYLLNNIVAFILSVAFAYFTIKIFVFHRSDWSFKTTVRELLEFYSTRLFTFFLEDALLYVSKAVLHADEFTLRIFSLEIAGLLVAKFFCAGSLAIVNYGFSKLWIFKKKKAS